MNSMKFRARIQLSLLGLALAVPALLCGALSPALASGLRIPGDTGGGGVNAGGVTDAAAAAKFPVAWGESWDHISLQDVFDAEYGPGVIDAKTSYLGYHSVDPDPIYWEDDRLDGILVVEIAGNSERNTLGWYQEEFVKPVIDGVNDGVIFEGYMSARESAVIHFPLGLTRFGLWLNPNGTGNANNAPEPEMFFCNRFYNDIGPSGSGAIHAPTNGDPQILVYNITHLRFGVPTFVIACEDLDSGGEITPEYSEGTDNDFQDMVIEISAISPVPVRATTWGRVKTLFH